jgi:hypothetical protein
MTMLHIRIPAWLDFIFTLPLLACRLLRYGYTFRKIYLGDGVYTIVDPQDYYRLKNFNWFLSGSSKKFYAHRSIKIGNIETKTVSMHRLIMDAPKGLVVDHINGNGLDNRRANLRLVTPLQNHWNGRKMENTSSRFKGVCFNKQNKKWVAYINVENKRIYLGNFNSEIDAAKAYDEAAKNYRGVFAKLNFPKEIERSPRRLNLRSAVRSIAESRLPRESRFTQRSEVPIFGTGRLANWLGARPNFPDTCPLSPLEQPA